MENTIASCSAAPISSAFAITASTELSEPLRSFHGLSTTNIEPRLLEAPPERNDCPATDITSFT